MSQMHTHRPEYHSYLLRMWRDAEGAAWRIQLEDPFTGEKMGFASLANLFAYLNDKSAPAADHSNTATPIHSDSDPL